MKDMPKTELFNTFAIKGMDLRDYFAAHIIQGLIANNSTCEDDEVVIKSAWGLADKMMKARDDS